MKSGFTFGVLILAMVISGCGGHHDFLPVEVVANTGTPVTNTNAVISMPTNHIPITLFMPVEKSKPKPAKLIVTPATSVSARVSFVDLKAKFVVLTFPIGHMPPVESRMELFRLGLKVGEIKITGPQRDDSTVADLVTGEAEVGDNAR